MKAMETIQDLIDEAKLRILWWALCVFAFSYFLTHTSKSMWMNVPISILFVCALRILFNEVDFHRKVRPVRRQTYLSHLEKKQLSVNDSRLSSAPVPTKWKRKIDSPVVEAAMNDFIDIILKDFVIDLWYSDITPDREFPEQIRAVILDALGEISGRVKNINLVDLLTRDIIDLVGDHLDLFRRNQAIIGVDVMGTLSSEERDERLKHRLMASKELHPALMSPESEYKVLQRLMAGVLTVVLRPREAQCPVIRSIARELLTCLVIQPLMNFASPGYINELIEYVLLAIKDYSTKEVGGDRSSAGEVHDHDSAKRKYSSLSQVTDMTLAKTDDRIMTSSNYIKSQEEPVQPCPADWGRMLDAATQRRTEVLTPENLENMWTKGRNYKKKENKAMTKAAQESNVKFSGYSNAVPTGNLRKETQCFQNPIEESNVEGGHNVDKLEDNRNLSANVNKSRIKRSSSTSALKVEPDTKETFTDRGGTIISEFYRPDHSRHNEQYYGKSASDIVIHSVGQHLPKLRCRVMGAYFEKLSSKSFAVYSIAVTDADSRTWFVKRRYRNFERLHRHLKDIPNYTLHLPPKRIFSSSTEDAFVLQRCIQLDKYLQELLSIANVAEQHEVWDFLSVSSKNYSFGNSSSVMRTLAVNVDDAVDDIVRQFKGVSDGLMRKVVGSSSPTNETMSSVSSRNISWNAEEISKHVSRQDTAETANSFSDNDESYKYENHEPVEVGSTAQASGWHSDNELNSKNFPPRVVKQSRNLGSERKHIAVANSEVSPGGFSAIEFQAVAANLEVPPEWTPPNVSVPLLNLVDKIFQLKKRGWLRRQVFWISKQILQLVMEDAIDDFLLRQIHWLRREDVIAQGIRWIQDILWPGGEFFLKVQSAQSDDDDAHPNLQYSQNVSQFSGSKVSKPGSFEEQLEAARRASDVKKMLFDGAPTTLVSLIGQKQYKRCAKDIYYFTQSTVCVKQLAFAILELSLVSLFPELRNLILDVHEKTRVYQPV